VATTEWIQPLSLIAPPNLGSGGESCLPLMVVVALELSLVTFNLDVRLEPVTAYVETLKYMRKRRLLLCWNSSPIFEQTP
jgi:hypothetical protein